MNAALCLVLPLLGAPDHATAMEALQGGRFVEAERALRDEADPLLAARGRAELLFQARDFESALLVARKGLATAPADLELLHRASAACLWLGREASARGFAERLVEAIGAADLGQDEREAWRGEATAFLVEADRLRDAAAERERVVRRARLTACGLLAAAGAALLLLAR